MLVIGGGVNGGKFYGPWPGLAEEQLFQDADVFALTDYRTIFSEVLRKRLGNNQISTIFPGFSEAENQPLGVVSGSLVKPEIISRNGFE